MSGKRFRQIRANIEKDKVYPLAEAIALIKTNATARFDETVELAANLNINSQKTDQNIRGTAQLPHGTGRSCRVAAFARGSAADAATAAGADIVGAEDLVEQIQRGELNFDRCVSTPDMMVIVSKVAKILGPRGLMPSPKTGTVSTDIAAAVAAVKGGQIEFRTDKGGVVHAGIGKASFDAIKLEENIKFLLGVISKEKPTTTKGVFIKKTTLSSTMGCGVVFTAES
ncbi:MAG: 50S ribosomal protein L1 [Holosporales bacterium]|jgi:large subunit ribosomal protein L1|nr:50S ribosomal protein L1 [Holosporales bacterium]